MVKFTIRKRVHFVTRTEVGMHLVTSILDKIAVMKFGITRAPGKAEGFIFNVHGFRH